MAVTITLEDRTAAALASRARDAGLSLEEYLRKVAGEAPGTVAAPPTSGPGTVEDFDAALDELLAGDTHPLPATRLTYIRDEIYDDHD